MCKDAPMRPPFLLSLILILLAGTVAAEPIRSARGDAYDGDGRLLFRQTHYWYAEAGEPRGFTLYACPDGHAFARRISDYGTHPATPDFALEIAHTGYREGVRSDGTQRIVYVQRRADQIGRASCRERCWLLGVAVSGGK